MKKETKAKKLSAAKLQSLADEMFKYHETVDTFYGTEDGQFFTKKNHADFHAREEGLKKPTAFSRNGNEEEAKEPEGTVLPEGAPDKTWKVDQIREWMTANKIGFDEGDTKAKLIEKIGKVDDPETRKADPKTGTNE